MTCIPMPGFVCGSGAGGGGELQKILTANQFL